MKEVYLVAIWYDGNMAGVQQAFDNREAAENYVTWRKNRGLSGETEIINMPIFDEW